MYREREREREKTHTLRNSDKLVTLKARLDSPSSSSQRLLSERTCSWSTELAATWRCAAPWRLVLCAPLAGSLRSLTLDISISLECFGKCGVEDLWFNAFSDVPGLAERGPRWTFWRGDCDGCSRTSRSCNHSFHSSKLHASKNLTVNCRCPAARTGVSR